MASILGNEWHMSSIGNDILTENGTINDKQKIYNAALNTDLKEICKPVLHECLPNNSIQNVVLQIQKIRNISAPKANEESQAAPRMLKLTLTDGETYIQAIELSPIGNVSLKNTPPGTKLLIDNAKIHSGFILLTPQNCKTLGGKVGHLYQKWEQLSKHAQINRRNNDGDDGPPPWVNFGTKIKANREENSFKSLNDKPKDPKESTEFDQQRQEAITEASSGAVKKIFAGRVKQPVQQAQVVTKPKPKRENGKFRTRTFDTENETDERLQKPSEKLSLFAFLEDKLPVNNQDLHYQNQSNKIVFKDAEYSDTDAKNDYKRRPYQKEFKHEQPKYNAGYEQNKPKENYRQNHKRNDPVQVQQNNSYAHHQPSAGNPKYKNDPVQVQQNNSYAHHQPSAGNPQYKNHHRSNAGYFPQGSSNSLNHNNSNSNSARRVDNQTEEIVNNLAKDMQKATLNGQFASRTLRQHLNLADEKKQESPSNEAPCKGMNIGDEVMAKYWEDKKYYQAKIISVTDKTFAVMFRDYGNIEEVLKSDCQSLSNNRANYNNQQSHRSNREYSGTYEYRRKNYKQ
ncbi:unnamed protein product [Phyllotreta striolata]|uniref:Tudor domain-containing protein n=1 Tax=Phyllotreta striolata TaxID=444603 RepID=A0A9N9TEN4_PHYSR|nr:unnamed protein product [Phyllotreta striolata]